MNDVGGQERWISNTWPLMVNISKLPSSIETSCGCQRNTERLPKPDSYCCPCAMLHSVLHTSRFKNKPHVLSMNSVVTAPSCSTRLTPQAMPPHSPKQNYLANKTPTNVPEGPQGKCHRAVSPPRTQETTKTITSLPCLDVLSLQVLEESHRDPLGCSLHIYCTYVPPTQRPNQANTK